MIRMNQMNNKELKQAINDDIETLKVLDVEIIPGRTYYLGLLKLVAGGIWKLGLVVFLTLTYVFIYNPTNPVKGQINYSNLFSDAAIVAFFMALGAMILLLSPIIQYYLIQYHLKSRLKTGYLLVNKSKQCAWFFLIMFALFCVMFASYAESAVIFLMIGFAFMGSVLITYLVMNMEINRIGISILFTLVNKWFDKDKVT